MSSAGGVGNKDVAGRAEGPALLVLGSPRSGVGLLAQALSLAGNAFPAAPLVSQDVPQAEPAEPTVLHAVNAQLLAIAGQQWSDWSAIPSADLAGQDVGAFADDTRTLVRGAFATDGVRVFADWRSSRFGEFWRNALGEGGAPKAVVATRNYESVVAGLQQAAELGGMHAALLWLRYTLDAEFGTRTLARTYVGFDSFVRNPAASVERVGAQLNLEFPDLSKAAFGKMSALISPAIAQFAGPQKIALPSGLVRDWLQTVQSITRSWSQLGERARDLFTLDEIRAELDRAGATFAHVLDERSGLTRKLGSVRRKLAKEEAGRASERKNLDQAIVDLKEQLAASRIEADPAKWEKQIAEKDKAVKALQDAALKNGTRIEDLSATIKKRDAALAEGVTARDALQAKLSQSLSDVETAERMRADLDQKLGAARDQATALQAQLSDVMARETQQNVELGALRVAVELHEKTLTERDGLMKGAMEARDGADARVAQLTEKFTEQLGAYQVLMQEKAAVEVDLVRSAAALDKAGHDLAWVEGEKQGLRRDLADRDVQLGRFQAELEAVKEQKASGDQRAAGMTSELEQLHGDLTHHKNELAAAHTGLSDAKASGDALQKAFEDQAEALANALAEQHSTAEAADVQAAQATDAIAALETAIIDRDTKISAVEAQLAALGLDVAQLHDERDALLQQRDVDADGLKSAETELAEIRQAVSEKDKLIEALKRDGENKAEKLAMQTAQLVASRAKQTQAQQERLAISDQLKQAHEELQQARGDLAARDGEAESLNQYLDAAREDAAKVQEELNQQLQKLRADTQTLGQHLQNARTDARALKDAKVELEKTTKAQLEEVATLKRDAEARDKVLDERAARLSDVESRLAQTQSALLQRQLETEESAEELRFLRSQLKDEQGVRAAKEEQLRLTGDKLEKSQADLLAEKDQLAKASLDHEKALQARVQEIALLMTALKDAQDKETDLAHMRVVRHELSRRTDSLYLLFVRVMDALLAQIASPLLPRKVNLRRQQAILEKYDLFDAEWYLEHNRDVRDAGMEAIVHFVAFGLQEGRAPNRMVDELRRSTAAMAEKGK